MREGPRSRSRWPQRLESSTQATAPATSASSPRPQTRAAVSPKPSPAAVNAAPSAAVAGARGEPASRSGFISKRGDPVDGVADHGLPLIALDLVGEEQPVCEHGGRERLDVVGERVVATA